MSSTSFTFDLEDVHFTLFEQLRIQDRLSALEKFADYDRDVYETTLGEATKLAIDVVAPINGPGDRTGCQFLGDGVVKTPKGYKDAWDQFRAGGWISPSADPELGGAGMPYAIAVVLQELFSGAGMAFIMYPGLTAAAGRVIHKFGLERWRNTVAQKLFSGEWGGTMCLTEPGAGSSVGDARTKAIPTDDPDVFMIEGEKIWITGGDHDLVSNICHLVLARTPDAPAGTKGLSLFLVPKFLFDDDMNLGERNGAFVTGIEHKMGINGSATTMLAFGATKPCKGYIVGEVNHGISLMFHMMNEARLGVGVQGLSAGSAAFQYARHYAKERIQGSSLRNLKDADAPRVAIVEHPDVRRMLMTQKVYVETMRSFAYRLAVDLDLSEHHPDEKVREALAGRVDLLVPILKSICTDLGFEVAVSAVQVFGGYGYTQEFPVEQVVRDAKIQSIYEGTNGIQALDLLGRKMRIGGGKLFMAWMQDAGKRLEAGKQAGFAAEADAINKAMQNVGASAMHIAGVGGKGNIDAAMINAVPFLNSFGYVVLGLEALEQAIVAKSMIESKGETAFLKGKLLNLSFYVARILPIATALCKTVQSGDASALDPSLFT